MEKTQTQSAPEAIVHPTPHMGGHDAAHGPTVNVYYTIFGCLAALTAVTVFVSRVHLPPVAAVVMAFLIAISKATLVVAFFMHLKYDPKILRVMCLVPVVLTMIAMMALMPDIAMSGPQAAGPTDVARRIIAEYESGASVAHGGDHAGGNATHEEAGEHEAADGDETSAGGNGSSSQEPAADAQEQPASH